MTRHYRIGMPMLAGCLLAACATMTAPRIDEDLEAIGIPAGKAACISERLNNDLAPEDLAAFSAYLRRIDRATSPAEGVEAVLRIDNPGIAGALAKTILPCALK